MSPIKLPFVVEPRRKPIIERIGSQDGGFIEIERRGYLSSGEKAFVQQAIGGDSSTIQIIGLARKIASKYSSTLEYAYADCVAILGSAINGDERLRQIEAEYFDEFNEIMNALSSIQTKEKLISAICMLKYRVNADIDVNDVMDLHPDIIDGLADLYRDEDARSITRLMEDSTNEPKGETGGENIEELEKKRGRPRKI